MLELPLVVAAVVAGFLWRFLAGQVVTRGLSPWDARYLTWAPPVPAEVTLMRGVVFPRTRWARRPGYHRQVVRVVVLVVLAGVLVVPVLTGAALAGAVAAAVALRVSQRRRAAVLEDGPWTVGPVAASPVRPMFDVPSQMRRHATIADTTGRIPGLSHGVAAPVYAWSDRADREGW